MTAQSESKVPKPTVLVLDDEKNIRQSIEIALAAEGIEVLSAHDVSYAFRILHERIVDLAIVDIQLGEIDGITFFKKLRADGFALPVIFISGHATLTDAAQAVKIGGLDFLEKPFSAEKIVLTVKHGLELDALRERLRRSEPADHDIVGASRAIRQAIDAALKVAKTSASVLIMGESGTGKELIANVIHRHSARSDAPFVKVNCAAMPEQLIESELFGHERGAFTGASGSKRGLFETAHRGTIFLDEVAELSPAAQAKVLRVLQSGEIQKVGAERTLKVDVRLLSATHRDLKQAVNDGRFREDLYYRLSAVPIAMPSLRERVEDIPQLMNSLIARLCAKNNIKEKPIDAEVVIELQRYPWPGNVRELQNVLERLLIMSGTEITTDDLPEEILASTQQATEKPSGLKAFRDRSEREFIIATLRRHDGNVTQAALELGIRRSYLHKRMLVLRIEKRDYFA